MTRNTDFSPQERDAIRREFMIRLSEARSIHDGFLVKRWATGPRKGEPKPSATVQSLLDKGFLEMRDDGSHWLKATFTDQGYAALKRLTADTRALPPKDFQPLLDELTALDREVRR
ncbi:MAG TPA: hypothetical protein VD860_05465 [Azospirillum sp.]|nr:hypothetical protein [Azospirillum sp.]